MHARLRSLAIELHHQHRRPQRWAEEKGSEGGPGEKCLAGGESVLMLGAGARVFSASFIFNFFQSRQWKSISQSFHFVFAFSTSFGLVRNRAATTAVSNPSFVVKTPLQHSRSLPAGQLQFINNLSFNVNTPP